LMLGHLKEEATAGGEDAAEEGLAAQPLLLATDQRETLELNLEYNETRTVKLFSLFYTQGGLLKQYFSAGCGTPVTSRVSSRPAAALRHCHRKLYEHRDRRIA